MNNPFNILIKEQLSSVTFVQDYLQLDFDGHKLTCYSWPEIIISSKSIIFPTESYRNILCSFIAKEVNAVEYKDEQYLRFIFNQGKQLFFNLLNSSKEVIYFTTYKGEWASI